MEWEVEYTDEFEDWWDSLDEDQQESVATSVLLLEARGPMLAFPFSSGIEQSRHSQMGELRIQHCGRPYRVLYAFDPRRVAILLIVAIRLATIAGMRSMSRLPIEFMTPTSRA